MFWFTRIMTHIYGPESWGLRKQFELQYLPKYHKIFHTCTWYVFRYKFYKVQNGRFINDNLFNCSAHWNTQKTCWDISVDGITVSFIVDQATHILRSTLVFAILFLRDPGERNSVYRLRFFYIMVNGVKLRMRSSLKIQMCIKLNSY